MLQILNRLDAEPEDVQELQELFEFTAQTLAEDNDGAEILTKIAVNRSAISTKKLPEKSSVFRRTSYAFPTFSTISRFH